ASFSHRARNTAGTACRSPEFASPRTPLLGHLAGGIAPINVPPIWSFVPPNVPPHTPGFLHPSAHIRALVKATSHRGKEKGRTVMEPYGLICGARGRNRTGTPCGGGF